MDRRLAKMTSKKNAKRLFWLDYLICKELKKYNICINKKEEMLF